MNWTTLYITGKHDFRPEVRRKLEGSKVDFMPGYIEASSIGPVYDLHWISETTDLREVKEAIGSKLIWKYRLKFYSNLEDFIQTRSRGGDTMTLTPEEQNMVEAMRKAG
jgi:hypothetical protein